MLADRVLIDTQWNVNMYKWTKTTILEEVLIDTQWNVNFYTIHLKAF